MDRRDFEAGIEISSTTPLARGRGAWLGTLAVLVAVAAATTSPRNGGRAFLRGGAALELAVGLLVLVVAAVLVGTGLPIEM